MRKSKVKGRNGRQQRITVFMLAFLMILTAVPLRVEAVTHIPENVHMSINGGENALVRTINVSYNNNKYISLRDTARLFADTEHPFSVDINGGAITIITGEKYDDGLPNAGWSFEELSQHPGAEPGNNSLTIDGEDRRYFTLLLNTGEYYDGFISPMDLAMILNVDFVIDEADNVTVDTSEGFNINPARLESDGFFEGVNTVVAGDATTGEIFYGFDMETPYPIASTTKLMTCLLTMDAISEGTISESDMVTISEKAASLSNSQDGSVAMESGWNIPVSELLLGALLPSSNECALSLAEYIGGTEESFVEMMNRKAQDLGMTTAQFVNSNGLPVYTGEIIAAKTQNKMSGLDMFRMCAHLVKTYPQIKDITSLKTARMETLKRDLKNTNGLLYNMPEVNGLKTGTTDRSGACLVTSLTVQGSDGPHDIIVVVLGAENSQLRLRYSELMARYAKNVVEGEAAKISYSLNDTSDDTKEITSESIVRLVVDYALKKK